MLFHSRFICFGLLAKRRVELTKNSLHFFFLLHFIYIFFSFFSLFLCPVRHKKSKLIFLWLFKKICINTRLLIRKCFFSFSYSIPITRNAKAHLRDSFFLFSCAAHITTSLSDNNLKKEEKKRRQKKEKK